MLYGAVLSNGVGERRLIYRLIEWLTLIFRTVSYLHAGVLLLTPWICMAYTFKILLIIVVYNIITIAANRIMRSLYSSTCHGGSLGWTATCFGRPLLQCTNYFAMLMSLYPAATCLTRPADSQMLDPVPAKADSNHEWSTFWWMFHEDLLFTIAQWRPFHYGTTNLKSLR